MKKPNKDKKIMKISKLKQAKGLKETKISKLKKKSKRSEESKKSSLGDSIVIKKKPSKVDLKSVIAALKKDDVKLIVVRTALKYLPSYLKSPGLTKKLLKDIIRLWAESNEKIRVVCLLCLVRIYTKLKDKQLKEVVVKKLYTTFLEKCRITKSETMSMIGFMRHSLIELYKLDQQIAFKHADSTIQQLSITLKNAKSHKNEESQKNVLNWQFANCLILLSTFVSSSNDDSQVKTLTNQVIQLNLEAIELINSPRYYGFYCHLIENLINLSSSTGLFIPILPIIVRLIDRIDIPHEDKMKNKKPETEQNGKSVDGKSSKGKANDKMKVNGKSKRSFDEINSEDETSGDDDDDDGDEDFRDSDFSSEEEDDELDEKTIKKQKKVYNMELLNHVSLEEAHTLDYKLAVLDKLYELLIQYLASQSHRIAFPELTLLPCLQLKKWFKQNHGPNNLKFKSLIEKIKLDCQVIEEARKSIDFAFNNYAAVDAWEKKMRDSKKLGLPKLASQISTTQNS